MKRQSHNTAVVKMVGLTEKQIQEEFRLFFDSTVEKYDAENVGFGMVGLIPDSDLDTKILTLVDL